MSVEPRLSVRWLKLFSILATVVGILIIYMAARGVSAPLVKIGDVYGNYAMNYAVVRIRGNVTGPPYVDTSGGRITIRFGVDDGTGTMNVYIYEQQAVELLGRGLVPMPGDVVEVEGQLRVRETYTYLILQVVDLLRIEGRSTSYTKVYSLNTGMEGRSVEVSGVVYEFREVSSGLLFGIDTGEGYVDVLIPVVLKYVDEDAYNMLLENLTRSLELGGEAVVRGVVYLYRGISPEVVVRSLDEVVVRVGGALVKLSELSRHVGGKVVVEVESRRMFYLRDTRDYVLEVSDETGVASIVIPSELIYDLDPRDLVTGSRIKVVGTVFNETTISAARVVPVSSAFKIYRVSDVDRESVGLILAFEGKASSLVEFRGGSAVFTLSDGTGSIKVYVPGWRSHVPEDVKRAVRSGGRVMVVGYIDVYRGELEVVVYDSDGLEVS